MRNDSSKSVPPSGLPGFLGVCALIALVLSEIDIFLACRSGRLVPDLRTLVPAAAIFTGVSAVGAAGLGLSLLLYRRWSGRPSPPWRVGIALFAFIESDLFAEYRLTGELIGWADFGGWRFHPSPHPGLIDVGVAFLAAAGLAVLLYYLTSRLFRCGISLFLVTAIAMPPLVAAGSPRADPGPGEGRSNLVLVTIDTLRADFLGCYGAPRARTPFIDSCAREGIRFDRAYTASSLTGPSHASLMTSLYPRSHGLLYNGWSIDRAIVTLPQVLAEAGYRTGAVIHAFPLDRKYGLARGFDQFLNAYREEVFSMAILERVHLLPLVYDQPHRRGGHVIELATSWLKRYDQDPFFLWIHLYDVHGPYAPPAGFVDPALAGIRSDDAVTEGRADPTAANIERLRGLYAGDVRYVDHLLERFWDFLQRLGVADRTCLVLTSDHGEELLDHGRNVGHARFLYRSVCRVPLVLYNAPLPGHPVRVIPDVVRTVDMMPTLLGLLGVPIPEEICGTIEGESLLPLLTGRELSVGYAVSETHLRDGSLFGLSLVEGNHHLIRGPAGEAAELFDLARDPGEETNLVAESPHILDALDRRLKRWGETTPERIVRDSLKLDSGDIEALKALGYLQ